MLFFHFKRANFDKFTFSRCINHCILLCWADYMLACRLNITWLLLYEVFASSVWNKMLFSLLCIEESGTPCNIFLIFRDFFSTVKLRQFQFNSLTNYAWRHAKYFREKCQSNAINFLAADLNVHVLRFFAMLWRFLCVLLFFFLFFISVVTEEIFLEFASSFPPCLLASCLLHCPALDALIPQISIMTCPNISVSHYSQSHYFYRCRRC